MWPFNRNKQPKDKKVPKEVQQYYKSEQRERVGLAWLIAFFSLLLTVLLVVGLFFGGRWTWRKITGDDNNDTAQTSQKTTQPSSESDTSKSQNTANSSGSDSSSNSTSSSTESSGSSNSASGASNTSSGSSSSQSSPTASSNTAANQNLTNTGPSNLVIVFVITAVLGTLAHASYSRFKLQKAA